MSQKPSDKFGEQAQTEVSRLIERLATAAQEQTAAETARVAAAAKAEHDAVRRELEAARQERDAVARERDTFAKERDSSRKERDHAREERDHVRQELTSRVAERDAFKAEAAAAQEAKANTEAALQTQKAAAKRDLELREAAERLAAETRSALDNARLETSSLTEQLNSAAAARTTLEQEVRRLTTEAEAARHAAGQAAIDLETAIDEARAIQEAQTSELRDQVVGAVSRTLDGLLDTYRKLTVAKTVADVLDGLMSGLANDFARVALFNIADDRLEGTHQVGFTTPPVSSVTIPLSGSSFIVEAVKSGRVQGRTASALAGKASPFGGTPGFVLVVPIVLRGKAIAVIYADDGGQSTPDFRTPEQRVKLAQLLLYLAVSRMPRVLTQAAAPYEVARTA